MASYRAEVKPSAERELRRLPKEIVARVAERMEELSADPFPPQSRKLVSTAALYRVRIGDYRLIYSVDAGQRLVTVHHVRHRREAYRGLP